MFARHLFAALAVTALVAPLVAPAVAETPMTAAEFEAYTTGRTLTYAEDGVVYGIEEYRPGRRVLWAFLGDECREGFWYEDAGQICFVYEDSPETHCWTFTRDADRLIARFQGGDTGRELYEAARTDEPMVCRGPEVGV